jgi:hypothetical protein
MPLGSQPTESDPAPRLGVSENGHMHWPHWTGSGRMVGDSSITPLGKGEFAPRVGQIGRQKRPNRCKESGELLTLHEGSRVLSSALTLHHRENAPAAAKIKGEPLRDTSARQRRHPDGWRPVVLIEL